MKSANAESCRWTGSALKGWNVIPVAPENAKNRDCFAELYVAGHDVIAETPASER